MADSTSSPAAFTSSLLFCPKCGSVLPLPIIGQDLIPCARCPFTRHMQEYEDTMEEFVIHFNNPKKKKKKKNSQEDNSPIIIDADEFQGPTVERNCPRCNHDIMSYTTRQTRSADEGQTVFYTCIKCKFQDIEYS